MSLFSFDEESGYVSMKEHPAHSGFPASAAQLVELLEQSSYADFDVIHANIGQLFAPSDDREKDVLIVARAVDASIVVHVEENNMLAEARLTTARGGKLITIDEARDALTNAGVVKGINERALDTFLGQQFEQSPGSVYSGIVAHGVRAKDGTDARFVRLCMTAQDRVLSPQEKSGGKVDMRDLGAIITVKPGSPLMKRVPPTPGEKGYSVFGDILEPKPGKDFTLQVSEGTKISPEDPNLLIANAKGVPVAVPRGMRVDDVLCYDNVDVTTGHIEFDGSVVVSGDVKDGMKIKATGDITVIGFVESAHLESASAVTVMLGAIGRKRLEGEDFSCVIKAKRTISVGYGQYCHIESEQDLFIERQALHCDLKSKRLIRVGKGDTPRGKLIGGNVYNAMRIEAGEVGAPSGTRTRIVLAQDWYDLKKKEKEFKELDKLLSDKLLAVKRAQIKAKKTPASDKRDNYLKKLATTEQRLDAHYKRNVRNCKLVAQKLMRLVKLSRVKVNELMHPGIELTIAKDSRSFSRIYPPHSVKLDAGKITQEFQN
ncbi:DUF342 domain-containing protein [Pseudoalteromonas luteoviolacea]|uniref:Flagellar Assembly Protein A N-terminal region domain-containing protein n=1 Tax=Pseudoalteromonas luteoviolacea S4054 TaxID=1129367 RepID=A0A0F6AI74_9GAMM|nr:FapA family protein [Pseudoalteromonas luteoviolacea]AOT07901.1 hypothetical protein S4054249_08625 [Pseudoalteromonas luteoviolacea]AOT12817.1 hypothetical protein S40542_08625 [Pseudoalteromonas luteoviolacea]AOT17730.1 hypothetical protein S4054_08620 [Pseudoalteromonas luteoviolacea]KKE85858.1 hypothetical protein N479_00360 [Pseudoalteromonas luteoviolacea S4054]KZN74736.1 hypothetical protein N481_08740 [Pseudoalteromonas luteoviolacea S4047-1]